MPANRVLLLTGESGAGKSTIAMDAAAKLGGKHFSERDSLREIARRRGHSRSRHLLEAIGMEQTMQLLRQASLQAVQESPGGIVVLDGVYDRLTPGEIKRHYPEVWLGIVAVEAALDIRVRRCAMRMGGIAIDAAAQEVQLLDDFKVQVGYNDIKAQAGLVIVNEDDIETAVGQVVAFAKL